tara:strand:- start:984 stop:1511 length:528 start_codon:yes stop_codon:yes gene_type:complete
MGNPLLRVEAKPFTLEEILSEETEILLRDMWDSLEEAGGIGLAAPQIGISKQLAVIKLSEESDRYPDMETTEPYVIFNPQITVLDKEVQGFWEGCLSVPGLRGYVERPRKVRIDYLDENADERTVEVEDFLATVFQHELDHLIGMLYVDRMEDVSTLMYEDEMILQEVSEEEILD